MTLGLSPSTRHWRAILREEEVFPLDEGPAIKTILASRRSISSAMAAYFLAAKASEILIRSLARPLSIALFNWPKPLIFIMLHQLEYSLRVAAILDWRCIGISLLKLPITGG